MAAFAGETPAPPVPVPASVKIRAIRGQHSSVSFCVFCGLRFLSHAMARCYSSLNSIVNVSYCLRNATVSPRIACALAAAFKTV